MTRTRLGWCLAALATAATTLAPLAAEVPDWIPSDRDPESGLPLWVSVEEAAPNGELRWELFTPERQQSLRNHLWQVSNGRLQLQSQGRMSEADSACGIYIEVSHTPPDQVPGTAPAEIYRNAAAIFSGTVTDLAQGFYDGNPTTLFEVRVDQIIKASGVAPRYLLVNWIWSELKIEGEYLCIRNSENRPPPFVGGRVLLVLGEGSSWLQGPILFPDVHGLLFGLPDGQTSAPKKFEGIEIDLGELVEGLVEERSRQEVRP